jgi:pimeloyl-ACP methyl ester carboxylesterase
MNVDLVHVVTQDGVRLDGVVHRAAKAPEAWLPVDAVVCFHGVGGNFYSPYVFEPMAERLANAGCTVLRTSNRGHDVIFNPPASPNMTYEQLEARRAAGNRLGAAFELLGDSVNDWRAWIDYAASLGARRIAVWGHSLGGVKTIYYLATQADARVTCAIASSPPRFNYEMNVAAATGDEFKRNIETAERLIAEGTPNALMTVLVPNINVFTPRTFLDKYGAHNSFDILRHLPATTVPLLLTLGSEEKTLHFADLMAGGDEIARQQANLSYELIDGADHLYGTRVEELWTAISGWLRRVPQPVGA